MAELKLGMLVHDADLPDVGGQLVCVQNGFCRVITAGGEKITIPTRRVMKGSPRRHKAPLAETDYPGMDELIKLCNCAGCGEELVGLSNHPAILNLLKDRELVADRVNDRPYCLKCLEALVAKSMQEEQEP